MNFSQKNLEALARVNPIQAGKLLSLQDGDLALSLSLAQSESLWNGGGQKGTFSHQELLGKDSIQEFRYLYVLYGAGDGHFLRQLCKNAEIKELLIFEPSIPLFKSLLEQVDLTDVINHPKVHFILGSDARQYIREIEVYFYQKIDRIFFSANFGNLFTPGVEKIPGYQQPLVKFAESFQLAIKNLLAADAQFASEDAFRGLMNTVHNYEKYNAYPVIDSLAGVFQGKSGVIVGSGPSLKKTLPLIHKLKENSVIFACDSALKPLLKEGIEPHFVGCLERVSATRKLFADLQDPISTHMVALSMVHPDTFAAFPGRNLALHRDASFDRWLYPDQKRYFVGQTVSQLAMQSLNLLGCQKIYLFGIDCAYDPETGASHNSMVPEFILKHGDWEKSKNEGVTKVEVAGNDGGKRLTRSYWIMDTLIFRDLIGKNNLDVENVIPKNYGIPIPGTRRVDPENLEVQIVGKEKISELLERTISNLKNRAKPDPALLTKTKRFLQETGDFCLQQMLDLNEYCHEHDTRFAENLSLFDRYFAEIEIRKAKIMNQEGEFFHSLLMPIVQQYIVQNGYRFHKFYQDDKDRNMQIFHQLAVHMEWFKIVHSWSARLLHFLMKEKMA